MPLSLSEKIFSFLFAQEPKPDHLHKHHEEAEKKLPSGGVILLYFLMLILNLSPPGSFCENGGFFGGVFP
jgi:hypothetical protein